MLNYEVTRYKTNVEQQNLGTDIEMEINTSRKDLHTCPQKDVFSDKKKFLGMTIIMAMSRAQSV